GRLSPEMHGFSVCSAPCGARGPVVDGFPRQPRASQQQKPHFRRLLTETGPATDCQTGPKNEQGRRTMSDGLLGPALRRGRGSAGLRRRGPGGGGEGRVV